VGSLVSGNINPRQVVTHDKTIIRTFKNNFTLKLESSSSFLTLPNGRKLMTPKLDRFHPKMPSHSCRKNLHLGMSSNVRAISLAFVVSTPTLDGRIPSSDGEQ
jgi:hypothetical protein